MYTRIMYTKRMKVMPVGELIKGSDLVRGSPGPGPCFRTVSNLAISVMLTSGSNVSISQNASYQVRF